MAEIITVEDYKHKKADVNGNKHSVKAKSQAGHIWVKDIMTKKNTKVERYSARDLKNLCIFPENSADCIRSRRECCWCYIVSVFENTPKNLVFQGRV